MMILLMEMMTMVLMIMDPLEPQFLTISESCSVPKRDKYYFFKTYEAKERDTY